MPNTTESCRVMMPPSNFGERASIATAWHWVGSPISCTPLSSSSFRIEPRLYGVPRMRKLSGAAPQICLNPFDVAPNPPGRRDQRRGADFRRAADRLLQRCGEEHAVLDG